MNIPLGYNLVKGAKRVLRELKFRVKTKNNTKYAYLIFNKGEIKEDL